MSETGRRGESITISVQKLFTDHGFANVGEAVSFPRAVAEVQPVRTESNSEQFSDHTDEQPTRTEKNSEQFSDHSESATRAESERVTNT